MNPQGRQRMSFFPALPVPLGLPVTATPPHPCPYLPGRISVTRGFRCERVPGAAYQELLDAGFRRSGEVFYQPACPGCRACVPIRIAVRDFVPRKSQRRVWRRNRDLRMSAGAPTSSAEKHSLYRRYLETRHDGTMGGDLEEMEDFLYRSPTSTVEFCYRDSAGRLLAVGLCDVTPRALSAVYFYFDPAEGRRSLGTLSSLAEIRAAQALGLAWYYPGYWVEDCPKMAYKALLGPFEVLGTDGAWRPAGP